MSKQNSSQFRYVPHAYHPGEQLPQPASVGATSAQPSSSTMVPKKRKADALDETPASATSSTPHATRPLASPHSSPATVPSLPKPKTQTGRHPTNVLANKTHHPAAAAGSPSTGVAPVTLAAKPGGRSMNRHRMTMEERKQAMVSAAAASTSSLMSPSSSTAHATTTTSSTKPTRPSKKPKNVSATPTSSSKTPLKERTPDMRTTYGDPPVQSSVHPIESVTSRPEPITQLPDPRGATSSSRSAKEVNPLPVDWKLLVNESCTTLAQSSTWTPAEAIYHRRLARVSIDKRPDSTTLAISVQRVSVQKSRQEYGEKAVSYLWLSPAGRKDPLITLSDLSYVVDLTMMHVLERRLTTDETSQIAGILDTFNPVSLASTDDWFKRLNGLHPPPFKGEPPIILFNWADLESMIELLLLQHVSSF
ncbi:hypothetical protein DL93DRAFT_364702 [Clavulina sp. PMI_390]|nr:hypothetical protein DL93DRAFT_364702 [Clavulina sp. PMI_390]